MLENPGPESGIVTKIEEGLEAQIEAVQSDVLETAGVTKEEVSIVVPLVAMGVFFIVIVSFALANSIRIIVGHAEDEGENGIFPDLKVKNIKYIGEKPIRGPKPGDPYLNYGGNWSNQDARQVRKNLEQTGALSKPVPPKPR